MARRKREIPLVHPGEILVEDFLKPLGLTVNAPALALLVPSNRIYAIVEGERGISADTALRLGRYFATGPEFWFNLQGHYDLQKAKDELEETIEREVEPRKEAAEYDEEAESRAAVERYLRLLDTDHAHWSDEDRDFMELAAALPEIKAALRTRRRAAD